MTGEIEDLIDDIALLKDAVFVERFPRLLLCLFIANLGKNRMESILRPQTVSETIRVKPQAN